LHCKGYFISNVENPIYFNSLIDHQQSNTVDEIFILKKNLRIKFKYEIIFFIYLHFIFMQWFNFKWQIFAKKREFFINVLIILEQNFVLLTKNHAMT
jgi:hypothetical protein